MFLLFSTFYDEKPINLQSLTSYVLFGYFGLQKNQIAAIIKKEPPEGKQDDSSGNNIVLMAFDPLTAQPKQSAH